MGRTEAHLLHTGVRYALGIRIAVTAASSVAALLLLPVREPAVLVAVALGLNTWNLVYAARLLRGQRRWLVSADVAVLLIVCLTQPWTLSAPGDHDVVRWTLAPIAMTIMAYPWQIGPRAYVVATASLVSAHIAGSSVATPEQWNTEGLLQLWMVVEAGLSWMLYRMLRRGARRADALVAQREDERSAAAVAAARRDDEREHLSALHDTAAATLLMVGKGVVDRRTDWLSAQARRDLDVINGRLGVTCTEVDLVAALHSCAEHTPLRITWSTPSKLLVPAAEGAALVNGTREALTNAVRHAQVDEATVTVARSGNTVTTTVSDNGVGFEPESLPGERDGGRYGVRRSLTERMTRIGGRAEVLSRPGAGTTVRLSCDLPEPAPPRDDANVISFNLTQRMRWAVVAINLVILLGLDLPRLLASWDGYPSPRAQLLAMATLIAITLLVAVLTRLRRPLGGWSYPLAAVVVAVSAAVPMTMPRDEWLDWAHWSFREAGWTLLVVGIAWRGTVLVSVLVAQQAIPFVQLGLSDLDGDLAPGVPMATIAVLGYQLAVAMIATLMRPIAAQAAQVAHEQELLRTANAVADQLSRDRRERYADLGRTTAPLLTGLARGDLDPGDADIQRRCHAEAARMRRLFAEDSVTPDPLLSELRECVDAAASRGLSASLVERGDRPSVPERIGRTLVAPVAATVGAASSKARVTLIGAGSRVIVGVVADAPHDVINPAQHDGVTVSATSDGALVHVRSTWEAS